MGQDTPRRADFEEIVTHAAWVFEETLWIDINDPKAQEKAFRAAIEAALASAHRGFAQATRDDILEKAMDLSNEDDNDLQDDGVAALIWYAQLLDETLPADYKLEVSE